MRLLPSLDPVVAHIMGTAAEPHNRKGFVQSIASIKHGMKTFAPPLACKSDTDWSGDNQLRIAKEETNGR